jgi:hypothetical protein
MMNGYDAKQFLQLLTHEQIIAQFTVENGCASIAINWDVTGVIYIATRTPINQGGLYIIHEANAERDPFSLKG